MTEEETIRAAMRLLGQRTSPKKARASRRNGRLGGRKKGKSVKRAKPQKPAKIK